MRRVALLAASLAVVLAACSSSDKPGVTEPTGASLDAANFVARATAATEKAQTVRFTETLSLAGAPITATGEARFGATTVDASAQARTPIGPVQAIVVDGGVYLKGLGGGTPGRPWVKNAGASQQIASALQKADPRKTLPMLESVGTLRPEGTQTVNGVRATRYSVEVDLAKVAKANPDLAKVLDEAIRAGTKVQDVQLWVDAQLRPVRMISSAQLPNPAGKQITISQRVDYSDWGAPVTIEAPPADQVTER